jgi:hypothetical protein|tara:strand:+ start:8324 stop:8959 length:636 start_codon:yes stop_codon:yes gene_type:complete
MALVLNGSNDTITGLQINSANIVDGSIVNADINDLAASKLTGALPAISGASLTGISAGITQADQWRVTSNFDTANANIITTNWERNDNRFSVLGSGMSESSGIFTFPATGIYKIEFTAKGNSSNQQVRYMASEIILTSNNFSSEGSGAYGVQSISNDVSADATANTSCIFDVTNTSTHKCKFTVYSEHSITWTGSTSTNATYATFIRLGDT